MVKIVEQIFEFLSNYHYLGKPYELSGHIIFVFFSSFTKSSFVLVARPLPPSPHTLSGRSTKKGILDLGCSN